MHGCYNVCGMPSRNPRTLSGTEPKGPGISKLTRTEVAKALDVHLFLVNASSVKQSNRSSPTGVAWHTSLVDNACGWCKERRGSPFLLPEEKEQRECLGS